MIPNGIRIRPLGPLDLTVAAQIHRDAFGLEAWDVRALADIMAMPGAAGRFAVDGKLGDHRPLGFSLLLLVANDAELLTVAVALQARRRRVGTALIEDFLDIGTEAGAANAFLEVAEDNVPAQRLYARLGFRQEGVRRDYYRRPGNKRVAAHLLRRLLP
jgi:ribosomal-protein-alanine N-acetyltransferase